MTPAQLAVEADALLQGGRTPEEVATMQLLSDPEWVRLLRSWGEGSDTQPWTDHACAKCVPVVSAVWGRTDWLCLWHRARALPGPRELDDPVTP